MNKTKGIKREGKRGKRKEKIQSEEKQCLGKKIRGKGRKN